MFVSTYALRQKRFGRSDGRAFPAMGTGGPKKRSRVGVRGDDIASEVINHFWMGHAPETMSVTYSRLHWKLGLRFAEAQSMGVGFTARSTAPSCSKIPEESEVELVLQL